MSTPPRSGLGLSARRRVAVWVSRLREQGAGRSIRPVCQIKVDLRRLPWGADLVEADRRLRQAPGAVDVKMNTRHRRAVLFHDARAPLPDLWNWLQSQGWRP